jgi:hypothetical protein
MSYRIHINSNTIRSNKKHGKQDPPITIRDGNRIIAYTTGVTIFGESKVVYSPDKPLACGAKVWIETDARLEYEVLEDNN